MFSGRELKIFFVLVQETSFLYCEFTFLVRAADVRVQLTWHDVCTHVAACVLQCTMPGPAAISVAGPLSHTCSVCLCDQFQRELETSDERCRARRVQTKGFSYLLQSISFYCSPCVAWHRSTCLFADCCCCSSCCCLWYKLLYIAASTPATPTL
jgi:hypothetical protein